MWPGYGRVIACAGGPVFNFQLTHLCYDSSILLTHHCKPRVKSPSSFDKSLSKGSIARWWLQKRFKRTRRANHSWVAAGKLVSFRKCFAETINKIWAAFSRAESFSKFMLLVQERKCSPGACLGWTSNTVKSWFFSSVYRVTLRDRVADSCDTEALHLLEPCSLSVWGAREGDSVSAVNNPIRMSTDRRQNVTHRLRQILVAVGVSG